MPLRRSNDPIKDFAGELMEIRAGVKSMVKSLTERGLNPEEHAEEIAGWLAVTDALSLAFDSDPRRINDAGALQITAGYLQSGGDKQGS
jgi:capsid protein